MKSWNDYKPWMHSGGKTRAVSMAATGTWLMTMALFWPSHAAWASSSSSPWPSSTFLSSSSSSSLSNDIYSAGKIMNPRLVSTGIKNLGNTCYMNAQLECAFHIPLFRKLAIEEDLRVLPVAETPPTMDDETLSGSTSAESMGPTDLPSTINPTTTTPPKKLAQVSAAKMALRELILQMVQEASEMNGSSSSSLSFSSSSSLGSAVVPRSFCHRLGIPVMVQQDSQEFWKLLLPALQQESITDLYKGSYEGYITALDGSGRERRREEVFLDLSVDVSQSSTLMDSIEQSFGKPEVLSVAEGNGWRPEKGAEKVDAHKGSSLIPQGLPPILQFHLKRFQYNWQTDQMTKVNKRLSFPLELDLSVLCGQRQTTSSSQPGVEEVPGDASENNNDQDQKKESLEQWTLYDLQSIVIHQGQCGAGHYYAYVRPDITSDVWYRFNDHIVEPVSWEEVFCDAYGVGGEKMLKGGSASSGVGVAGDAQQSRGFLRRMLSRVFTSDKSGRGGSHKWGGSTSNAYVIQYVRRSDRSKLYCIS